MKTAKILSTKIIPHNSQYRLIYQYNGDSFLTAEMTFTGKELVNASIAMERLILEKNTTCSEVQDECLTGVLKLWGRMATRQRIFDDAPSYAKKDIKRALDGKRKARSFLRHILCMYLLLHVERLAETNTLIVKDIEPDHELMSVLKNSAQRGRPLPSALMYGAIIITPEIWEREFENNGMLIFEYPKIQTV